MHQSHLELLRTNETGTVLGLVAESPHLAERIEMVGDLRIQRRRSVLTSPLVLTRSFPDSEPVSTHVRRDGLAGRVVCHDEPTRRIGAREPLGAVEMVRSSREVSSSGFAIDFPPGGRFRLRSALGAPHRSSRPGVSGRRAQWKLDTRFALDLTDEAVFGIAPLFRRQGRGVHFPPEQ